MAFSGPFHPPFRGAFRGGFSPRNVSNNNPNSISSLLTWHFSKNNTYQDMSVVDLKGASDRDVQGGRCYLLDGTDDYVDCGDISNSLTALSCFAWINTTTSATGYVFSRYETLSNQRSFFVCVNATGVLDVLLSEDGQYNNSSKIYKSTATVNDGDWHHVGFTWGSGTLKVYIDGAEATVTKTEDDSFTSIHDSTNPFLIGAMRTGIENFDGSIYGVQVFNNTLSDSEVSRIYADMTDYDTAPIGYWRCDEGGGLKSYDSSANAHHGTIINATLSTFHDTDVGVNISWQNDSGYNDWTQFSGQGEYVQINGGSDVTIGQSYTLNMWIRWDRTLTNNECYLLTQSSNTSYSLGLRVAGPYSFYHETGNGGAVLFTGNYVDDEELHMATITRNDTTLKLYIDGVLVETQDVPSMSGNDTKIRNMSGSNSLRAYGGLFPDFAVFTTDLDADEVTEMHNGGQLMNATTHSQSGNLAWQFRDDGDGTYTDLSGNYTPAMQNTPATVYVPTLDNSNDIFGLTLKNSGRVKYNLDLVNSNCATFDGVDDEIDFGNPAEVQFQPDEPFTISFWADISGSSNINYSFLRYSDGGSSFRGYRISINRSTGVVTFRFGGSSRTTQFDSSSSAINFKSDPKNIVIVYDPSITDGNGNAQCRIYADGVFVQNMSASGSLDTGQPVSYSGLTFKLGETAPFQNPFSGIVHNFSIYSDNLTADEIANMYAGNIVSDSLAFYIPMAEGAEITAYDASGNGNHGTITNATLSTFWGTKQDLYHYNLTKGFTQNLYFDGTSSVEAGNTSAQDETTGDFTVLAWVNPINDSFAAGVDSDMGLISKTSVGAGNQYGYVMYVSSGGLRAELNFNGTRYVTSNSILTDYSFNNNLGTWVLCAVTFDRDGDMTAKLVDPSDGTVYSSALDISGEDGNSISNTNTFTLGSAFLFTSRDFWGYIKQAAKFSSLLTDSELQALNTAGIDHSFADDVGDYSSSSDLTGHWIQPYTTSATWEDTQGSDDLTPSNLSTLKTMALVDGTADAKGYVITNPAFYGHNNAETEFKQKAVAPAIKSADDNLTNPFWFTGATVNEIGFNDVTNNPDDDNIIYADVHEADRMYNLLMFEDSLSSEDSDTINNFVNGS